MVGGLVELDEVFVFVGKFLLIVGIKMVKNMFSVIRDKDIMRVEVNRSFCFFILFMRKYDKMLLISWEIFIDIVMSFLFVMFIILNKFVVLKSIVFVLENFINIKILMLMIKGFVIVGVLIFVYFSFFWWFEKKKRKKVLNFLWF